jgi:alpha-N-arabinofuranosidase
MQGNQSVATIDALATVDESGKTWAIALTNRHPTEKVTCTVKMGDTPLEGRYDAAILAGDSPEAYNDIEHPDRVTPMQTHLTFEEGRIELPPHSLTIVTIPLPRDRGN